MQGFQPIYSGNTLTQAAGRAGQFIVAAGEARGRMYESIGQTIGGLAKAAGTAYAQYSADNAVVPESTVNAAEASGVDFGRKRIGGGNGIPQYTPVTQKQYDLAMSRSKDLSAIQTATLGQKLQLVNLQSAALAAREARLNVDRQLTGFTTLNDTPLPGLIDSRIALYR